MNVATIARLVGGLVGCGLISCGCGGTSTSPKGSAPIACEPGSRRCDGSDIKRCDESGTSETLELSCSGGQCRIEGNAASCTLTACKSNLALCDGSIATQCKADGSGPRAGGVDCAASKQFCVSGKCQDTLCIAGTKSCQHGDVYLCAADGSSLSLSKDCADNEQCSDESGSCITPLCVPGKSICSGTRVITCNERGDAWLSSSTDCASKGKVCSAGSCEARACAPSTTFCQDGNVYQCDPGGSASMPSKVCRPGFEHCQVDSAGSSASCVVDSCVAGQKLCSGNVIKTCNADNSLPTDGTACAKNEFCENAQCKPSDCQLGTLSCKDNAVFGCQSNGQSMSWECNTDQRCFAVVPNADLAFPEAVHCLPLPCTPGESACVQNQIGTCAADGTSLSAVTNDCTASGKVCTASATCAASVTDTLGQDKSKVAYSGSPYLGSVIDIRSARKLTELQMFLTFPSPRDVHWLVFEQVGDELLPRAETTTTSASSAGFVSSGPNSFSYQLEVGKRYALGVMLPEGSASTNDPELPMPTASFGAVVGSVMGYTDFSSFSIAPSFSAYAVPYMKVVSESP